MEPILDPRGYRATPPVSLASRPAKLASRRVLILDNEKLLGRPNYEPLLPGLQAFLRETLGVGECPIWRRSVLAVSAEALAHLGEEVAGAGPAGVVLLLGDAGAVIGTLLLAIGLEARGIPTVTLVTPVTETLAAAVAQARCPGLPVVTLDISHADARERVAGELRGAVPAIGRALTAGWMAPAVDPRLAPLAPVAPDVRLTIGASEVAADELLARLDGLRATDGLPVVAPTAERVRRMLAAVDRSADEVLRRETAPLGNVVTVEKLAVNAVMAGCLPEHFPVVVAAAEAMCDDAYRLDTSAITSYPGGNAVVVSGPAAATLGLHAGGGCLGPGFRANATIGRALTLMAINVLRAVPGLSDLSTLGSPAEYSYCFAENLEESPWPGLHAERYGTAATAVTVLKAEAPHNFLDEYVTSAEELLELPAAALSTIANNNAYRPGSVLLILNPHHAEIVARSGWRREDVQRFIHERARVPEAATRRHGSIPKRPDWMAGLEEVPVTRSPEDVLVVVAGARGPQSMVAPTWGFAEAVSRPVVLRE
jgi:hypothetical protein